MKVHHDEGVAIHIGPESCAVGREAAREALTGERVGQPLNHEIDASRVPTFVLCAEGNMSRRDSASAGSTRRGLRPGMHGRSLRGNRGASGLARVGYHGWSASGRRGAEAGDERSRGARSCHSSYEPCEQSREYRWRRKGSQGQEPREMRISKARAGHRTGKVCPMRWTAYGKPLGKGRRRSAPRSSTTSIQRY